MRLMCVRYDMEFGGAFYPGVSFARQMTQMAQQEEGEEAEMIGDEGVVVG